MIVFSAELVFMLLPFQLIFQLVNLVLEIDVLAR